MLRSLGLLVLAGSIQQAHAQASPPAAQKAASATYIFDQPAQPLPAALKAYARAAHQQVVFDGAKLRGLRAVALKGRYSALEALHLLADPNNLSVSINANGLVIVTTAEASQVAPDAKPDIVVIGSFIPRQDSVLPIPVSRITQKELTRNGFSSAADAIQKSVFATGQVVGADTGYSQGVRTANLFSLGPDYTKYLIDGRPMSTFPGLYNNTTMVVDLGSLPTALIESVEILPGGQSSLYGADAVAGVVNTRLRKKVDAPEIDIRHGFTDHGGGQSWRISGAGSVSRGAFDLLLGAQYDAIEPIWGYQRKATAAPFAGNTNSPATPEQTAALYSASTFQMVDVPGKSCARLAPLYDGGVSYYNDGAGSAYCGNSHTGFNTLTNKERRLSVVAHSTLDLGNDNTLFADVMVGHAVARYAYAQAYAYYYSAYDGMAFDVAGRSDPVYVVRYFSPEERGGTDALLSREQTDTLHISTGATGRIGDGEWRYDLNLAHNHQNLTDQSRVTLTAPMQAYFSQSPGTGGLESFFAPIAPATINSFYTDAVSRAASNSNSLRALITNGHLLHLPGGDAGVALGVEAGNESWRYVPDPGYDQQIFYYNLASVSGAGKRDSRAAMGEIRLPVLPFLTLSGSARYDGFRVASINTGRFSYNVAAEIEPVQFLSLRGRYGTAFKAPTLSDLFQGPSTQLAGDYDYLTCGTQGISVADCQLYTIFTQRLSGNRALKPMTAKVADLGLTLHSGRRARLSADWLHWDVRNGVAQEDAGTILRDEALCAAGSAAVDAARCAAVAGYVTRTASGALVSVFSPKVNVARKMTSALILSGSLQAPTARLGTFSIQANYMLFLERKTQPTPESVIRDALSNPLYMNDFRSRTNVTLGWEGKRANVTLYFDRVSRAANYAAMAEGSAGADSATLPAQLTANLGLGYQLNRHLTLAGSITNLFDKMPPTDNTYPGYTTGAFNSQLYNVAGRTFQVEAKYRF
jgi:outer membrane receptor protein involved in Fe transport